MMNVEIPIQTVMSNDQMRVQKGVLHTLRPEVFEAGVTARRVLC